jgi:hypothetical protein
MAVISSQALPFSDVYIDESSHTGHRYLVLGGIIVATAAVDEACAELWKARLPELPRDTIKWTKVSRSKLPAYRRVVDKFFELQAHMTLDFHSLFVDTSQLDHGRYNKGSQEIGFNKEIYQLAMKFGRLYRCLFHVYPDRRTTNQVPEELRLMLNRGIKKKGDNRDWPYRRLQFREPDDCVILQLTDVLAGAIAYHLNGHYLATGASPAKCELMRHILDKANVRDPLKGTVVRGKFTVWPRKLR